MRNQKRRKWKIPQLKVYREFPSAKLPTKGHDNDHCFDFYAAESVDIRPGETVVVPLGLRIELPKGYALVFKERSGLACKGIIVGAGVIDEGYRGPLNVVLRWMIPYPASDENASMSGRYKINVGDKIAQAKLERTLRATIIEINDEQFSIKTRRGEKGFGSSGAR